MSVAMAKDAWQTARANYDTAGYAIFRGVLDSALLDEAREHIDWLLQRHPGTRPEQLHHYLMQKDAFWVRLISDPRLLDIAELFIGPDIALFASHYVAKRPYDGQAVLWHQDGTYWPLEPMQVVTLWLAIDRSTPENGCMRVIPGTQTERLLTEEELQRREDGQNVLGSGIDPANVDEAAAIDVILEAGDVSVHHPNLIHGSNANTSALWRRGLTMRYIPASTQIVTDEPHPSAFFLRGTPVPGINAYQPWPEYEEENSMAFSNCREWNEQCRKWNAIVASSGKQR